MVVFNYLYQMFTNTRVFFFPSKMFLCVCFYLFAFVCVRDQCSRTVREQLNFLNEQIRT
ncbi:hypothetical protein Hanom_Chr00s001754g01687501 [Helianthus anomalus]